MYTTYEHNLFTLRNTSIDNGPSERTHSQHQKQCAISKSLDHTGGISRKFEFKNNFGNQILTCNLCSSLRSDCHQ